MVKFQSFPGTTIDTGAVSVEPFFTTLRLPLALELLLLFRVFVGHVLDSSPRTGLMSSYQPGCWNWFTGSA